MHLNFNENNGNSFDICAKLLFNQGQVNSSLAAVKFSPYIAHSVVYILLLVL